MFCTWQFIHSFWLNLWLFGGSFWFFDFFWEGGRGKIILCVFLGSYSDDDIYLFDISQGTFELLNLILIIPWNYSNQELVKFLHFFLIFSSSNIFFLVHAPALRRFPPFFTKKNNLNLLLFAFFVHHKTEIKTDRSNI